MSDILEGQIAKMRELIGEWIKEFRISKNLTQTEVADILGVSKPTISKIESGRWLSLEMLIKLSVCLDFYIFLCDKKSDDDLATIMRHRFEIAHNKDKPAN